MRRRLVTALVLHACSPAPVSDASRARFLPAATELPGLDGDGTQDRLLVDLDQNGDPDLVELFEQQRSPSLHVVHNLAHGPHETTRTGLNNPDPVGSLAAGDFDGDGAPDVVFAATDGAWLYSGSDLTGPYQLLDDGAELNLDTRPAVGDVDGDGVPELALAGFKGRKNLILVWRGGRTLIERPPAWILEDVDESPTITFADVDGDGDEDLVGGSSTLVVWSPERGGLPPDPAPLWTPPPGGLRQVQTVPDVDGDGDDELAILFSSPPALDPDGPWSGLVLLLGGDMTERWLPVPHPARPIATADVDDDGHIDLVASLPDQPGLLWLPGGPDGPTAARAYRSTPADLPPATLIGAFSGHAVVRWGNPFVAEHRRVLQLSSGDEDEDQDGFPATVDPDDHRPEAWPGAPELLGNGLDEDGDGWDLCARDDDRDGFTAGDLIQVAGACDTLGFGAPSSLPDCDDQAPRAHPGATEPPGAYADLNCDGFLRCFRDADGDSYPSEELLLPNDADCDDPEETSLAQISQPFDCDDTDPDVNPSRRDLAGDGVDQNCDGVDPSGPPGAGSGCQHAPAPLFLGLLIGLRWRRRLPAS
jgi:hypothetical protein